MKKIFVYVLVIASFFTIAHCMEEERELNLGNLKILPVEIRYRIITSIIEDFMKDSKDLFNIDKKSLKKLLDSISLVSKDFNVFEKEELKKFVKRKRFLFLKEYVKNLYKDWSEVDRANTIFWLIACEQAKENLQKAVGLILAGTEEDVKTICGHNTFIFAAWEGYVDLVGLLIENGVDINSKDRGGRTALSYAASFGRIKVVKLLHEHNAELDSSIPLLSIAKNGLTEIAELLIGRGININIKDSNDESALMYAIKEGRIEMVKLLLENGADFMLTNKAGKTALMIAKERGCTEVVMLLTSKMNQENHKSWYSSCTLQ